MTSTLAGAWQRVADTGQMLVVFTDTHFCCLVENVKNRKGFADKEKPTVEEAAEAFHATSAWGGTYTISGSKLTLHRTLKSWPIPDDSPLVWNIKVEGDRLTHWRHDQNEEDGWVWEKVS